MYSFVRRFRFLAPILMVLLLVIPIHTAHAEAVVNAVTSIVSAVVEAVVSIASDIINVVSDLTSGPLGTILLSVALLYFGMPPGLAEFAGVAETASLGEGLIGAVSTSVGNIAGELGFDAINAMLATNDVLTGLSYFRTADAGVCLALGFSITFSGCSGGDGPVGVPASTYAVTSSCVESSGTPIGCPCYGPSNSCGQSHQGTVVVDASETTICQGADGSNITTLGAPPESSCPVTPSGCGVGTQNNTCIAKLWADPNPIDTGQKTYLKWTSTNATSCTSPATPDFTLPNHPANNTTGVSTGPLTTDTQYAIKCTGPGGAVMPANTTITVYQPQVTITASPTRVTPGGSSIISWTAKQVGACSITGPHFPVGGLTLPDSPRSVTVSTQGVYTITCKTNGDDIIKSVIVNVVTIFQEY